MAELSGKTVILTGASGFLGRYVQPRLEVLGATVVPVSRKTGFDLLRPSDAFSAVSKKPDVVVHLAARGDAMNSPGAFFYDNMLMGMNVIHACAMTGTRLIVVGDVCSYAKDCPVPFKEEDFWNGYPESGSAPYGIAKKAMLVMCQAYRKEYGLRYGYLCPADLYGPCNSFHENPSRIIPVLIKKLIRAKEERLPEIVVFGVGKVTRSFLYVRDAAKAIGKAAYFLDYDDVINLPGSREVSMEKLAGMLAGIVGYEGKIAWDASEPDGQPRRYMDGARASLVLGWRPEVSLEEGLSDVVQWCVSESAAA